MHHFFEVYKSLENKKTYVLDIGNKEKAKETIQEAINRYNEVFK